MDEDVSVKPLALQLMRALPVPHWSWSEGGGSLSTSS